MLKLFLHNHCLADPDFFVNVLMDSLLQYIVACIDQPSRLLFPLRNRKPYQANYNLNDH